MVVAWNDEGVLAKDDSGLQFEVTADEEDGNSLAIMQEDEEKEFKEDDDEFDDDFDDDEFDDEDEEEDEELEEEFDDDFDDDFDGDDFGGFNDDDDDVDNY